MVSIMKYIRGSIGVVLLVLFDQLTKILAKSTLQGKEPIVIIENVFQLQYLENKGAAFGILQNQMIFLIVVPLITLCVIVYFYIKTPMSKKFTSLRIIMIFVGAGAIGNFIDRLIYGYVIDFFYFELIDFPIFNIADCYVSISAVILIILFLFYYKEEDFKVFRKKA